MHDRQDLNPACGWSVIKQVVAGHMAVYLAEALGLYPLSDSRLGCQQIAGGSRFVEPGRCRVQIVSGNLLRDLSKVVLSL